MNPVTVLTSQFEEVNHIYSWEEAMNFLSEGQLERKARQRSIENVMGEPEPAVNSRTGDIKGTQPL